MERIKREIKVEKQDKYEIEAYGINSKGTFTIACKEGILFNINGLELKKLKEFLEKI